MQTDNQQGRYIIQKRKKMYENNKVIFPSGPDTQSITTTYFTVMYMYFIRYCMVQAESTYL